MAFDVIKKMGNLVETCKAVGGEKKPQLVAFTGAGFMVGSVYFACKETPKANEAVEAKREIDPELSKLEEIAISIPKYAKTLTCMGLGLGCTYLAWRFEALKYAALAATCAQLADENSSIRQAVNEITGPMTADKVEAKAAEIRSTERVRTAGDDSDRDIPSEYHTVPFSLSFTGKSWYDTKSNVCRKLNKAVEQLCKTGWLSFADFTKIVDGETNILWCDLCDETIGWTCREGDLEDAKNTLDWYFDTDMDEYGRLCYVLHVSKPE